VSETGKTRDRSLDEQLEDFRCNRFLAMPIALAIPFAQVDITSLPLSIGVLSGLMWVPFSGLIQHWVGLFHGITRTFSIFGVWYAFPDHRFAAIPAVIVVVYLASIFILAVRARKAGIRPAG
jgi:hypothetical protein